MWRPRHGIILTAIALLGLGLIVSQSAGLTVGARNSITVGDVLLGSTSLKALGAVALLLLAMHLPVNRLGDRRWWASPVPWAAVLGVGLVLATQIPGVGVSRNGAVRWMEIGPVGFQPSELAKWFVPLAIAWWAARQGRRMDQFGRGLLPALMLLGLTAAAVGVEDLGTAVVITCVGGAVLLAGGARIAHVAGLAPVGLGLAVFGVLAEDYRRNRILAFLEPFEDPEGLNYHMIQSLTAITGGGAGGRGLGNGLQKFGYLLEDTTDFIFAVICEEMGVAGAALVLFLFAALVCSCLLVARRTSSPFARLLVVGVTATIGLQAFVNLAVVTGLAPTKGIALPLVSHGGTGWWMTAACLGLVCAVDRASDRELAGAPLTAARPPAGAGAGAGADERRPGLIAGDRLAGNS
jgi:cell division protein FtsW